MLGSAWEQALERAGGPGGENRPRGAAACRRTSRFQQAKNFSIALHKGDPDEVGVIRGAARQVLENILPGKE